MRRLIISAALLAAMCGTAMALDINVTVAPFRYDGGPRIIHVDPDLDGWTRPAYEPPSESVDDGKAKRWTTNAEEAAKARAASALCAPVRLSGDTVVIHRPTECRR
jgi:hypothetical protein